MMLIRLVRLMGGGRRWLEGGLGAGFLASEKAGHITGQVLAVNGGAHLGR